MVYAPTHKNCILREMREANQNRGGTRERASIVDENPALKRNYPEFNFVSEEFSSPSSYFPVCLPLLHLALIIIHC
jgi:hypothetical protein